MVGSFLKCSSYPWSAVSIYIFLQLVFFSFVKFVHRKYVYHFLCQTFFVMIISICANQQVDQYLHCLNYNNKVLYQLTGLISKFDTCYLLWDFIFYNLWLCPFWSLLERLKIIQFISWLPSTFSNTQPANPYIRIKRLHENSTSAESKRHLTMEKWLPPQIKL